MEMMFQVPVCLQTTEVPAWPTAEICGKGSYRHGKKRFHAKKLQRATQHLLRKVTELIPKQCRHSGLQNLQVNTRNIAFSQHPKRKKTMSLWVRNVSTSALHFIQVHHKRICFRQGKVDIQQNHCLLQCLHYPCTLST